MDEKRIQCLSTHRSMYCIYPSIFNRFPVIQPVSSKVRHFSTFLDNLTSPGYAPGTFAVNVTWMERGCWLNALQHIPIYLQPFTNCGEILVGNCNFFPTPLHLTSPLGVIPLDELRNFCGWVAGWCKNITEKLNPWVRCTHVTDDRHDRRQADGFAIESRLANKNN